MSNELPVFVADRPVGTLREDIDSGLIDFQYHEDTPPALAVSLLMPPDAPPEDYLQFNGLPPPFEVSLPEGMLLEAIRSRFGKDIDVSSDFELLRLVGRHTIGRVTFGGPLERVAKLDEQILAAARSERSATRLATILREQPQMFGMSGVMPKMSFHDPDRKRPGTPRSQNVIVKFDSDNFTGASLVEFACLRACDAVGLDVPSIDLSPDRAALLVERFDIGVLGQRRGFEDACALSGIRRSGKYNGSIEHLFDMIRNFVPPDAQQDNRLALLKLIIMNDILRNGDAHLKNFGLLYDDVARPRLAPVFDVLTTPVWIHHDEPALAMRKADREHCPWMGPQELHALGELAELPTVDIESLHRNCAEIAVDSLLETFADCPDSPQREALERAIEIVESGLSGGCRPRPRQYGGAKQRPGG